MFCGGFASAKSRPPASKPQNSWSENLFSDSLLLKFGFQLDGRARFDGFGNLTHYLQHVAGMKESGIVISINTDPEAPINQLADYVITGSVEEVVPKMIKYYKENSK